MSSMTSLQIFPPSFANLAARAHALTPTIYRLVSVFSVTFCGLLFVSSVLRQPSVASLMEAIQAFQQQGVGTMLMQLLGVTAILIVLLRYLNNSLFALAGLAAFAIAPSLSTLDGVFRACLWLPLAVYFWRRAAAEPPWRSIPLVLASVVALHVFRLHGPVGSATVAGWSEPLTNAAAWIWTPVGLVMGINLMLAGWHAQRLTPSCLAANSNALELPMPSASGSTATAPTQVDTVPPAVLPPLSGNTEETAGASPAAPSSFNYPARTARFNFSEVVGMEPIKARLLEAGLDAMIRYGSTNGLLLFGAPGNGKTFLAEALAGELGLSMISVNFGTVASRFVNETTQQVMHVFDDAVAQAPCVLFLDEVEALLSNRSAVTDGACEYSRTTAALLARIVEIRSTGVVLVAATNFLDRLDCAAVREGRFDTKIEITPPDDAARQALILRSVIEATIQERTLLFPKTDAVEALARHWAGFSVSRIRAVARLAARRAVEQRLEAVPIAVFQSALRQVQGGFGDYVPSETRGLVTLHFDGDVGQRLTHLADEMRETFAFERFGGRLASGILFHGPSGTGKTIAARALAKSSGWAFIRADGTTLAQQPDQIKVLLQRAIDLKPCVLFVDEADALMANRAGSWSAAATNTFLSETGDDRASLRDVLLIAATNHPDLIDPAMTRGGRLGERLAFSLPTPSTIASFLRAEMSTRPVTATDDVFDFAGALLCGQSLADVKAALDRACNAAARRTLRHDAEALNEDRARLTIEDFSR